MTKIIFNNDMGEFGSRKMSLKNALLLLETIKAVTTFVFEGTSIAYTYSCVEIPNNADGNIEIVVYGEEVK
jgi:hypothetical protein